MSQQFGADAQGNSATVNIPNVTETTILTTNFIPVPFENGKARINGQLVVTPGTSTTALVLRVRRNPNAENLVVLTETVTSGFTVGSASDIGFGCVDPIPDGRSVQYAVTVQQTGGAAAGTAQLGCLIDAVMYSG